MPDMLLALEKYRRTCAEVFKIQFITAAMRLLTSLIVALDLPSEIHRAAFVKHFTSGTTKISQFIMAVMR